MSDPGTSYRSREEIQEYRKQKDCIEFLRKNILDSKLANEEELNVIIWFKRQDIVDEVREEIRAAVEKSKSDPYPETSDLMTDVYINNEKCK